MYLYDGIITGDDLFREEGSTRPLRYFLPQRAALTHLETMKVVFTRSRFQHSPFKRSVTACAKRERCHVPHREQARRTRPSDSLEAPAKCSQNATVHRSQCFIHHRMCCGKATAVKKGRAEVAPRKVEFDGVGCEKLFPLPINMSGGRRNAPAALPKLACDKRDTAP